MSAKIITVVDTSYGILKVREDDSSETPPFVRIASVNMTNQGLATADMVRILAETKAVLAAEEGS